MSRRTSRDIRSESRLDVVHALLSGGSSTRGGLARATGLSPATVATVVTDLLEREVVTEVKQAPARVGRPSSVLAINATRGAVVGVDVAETYVRADAFDAALGHLATAETALDERRPGGVVDAVHGTVMQAVAGAGVDVDDVLAVGLALPGLVQRVSGPDVLVPGSTWRSLEIDRLRDRLGLPLVVDNPLKAIATAELWFGAGRRAASTVTVNLGTGVGAGIVLEQQVLRGSTNSAGEWGHSLLVLDGRTCRCGRAGCVEAYIGVPGIRATLAEVDPGHELVAPGRQAPFLEALERAARAGDPAAVETVARTARYLGAAVADLVAIVNPDQVMLTGWTAWRLGELLLEDTRAHLLADSPGESAADVRLAVSTVRGNSVATGVATVAMERVLVDLGLLTTTVPVAF